MQALLTRNLHDRIGANGFSNFTNHPFFVNAGIDFELLEKRQLQPIFRPSSEKTNFDATYDLEELLLEEAPLEARTKTTKPRAEPKADASPQERRTAELHRMIEQLFEPFNYTMASFEKYVFGLLVAIAMHATDKTTQASRSSRRRARHRPPSYTPSRNGNWHRP